MWNPSSKQPQTCIHVCEFVRITHRRSHPTRRPPVARNEPAAALLMEVTQILVTILSKSFWPNLRPFYCNVFLFSPRKSFARVRHFLYAITKFSSILYHQAPPSVNFSAGHSKFTSFLPLVECLLFVVVAENTAHAIQQGTSCCERWTPPGMILRTWTVQYMAGATHISREVNKMMMEWLSFQYRFLKVSERFWFETTLKSKKYAHEKFDSKLHLAIEHLSNLHKVRLVKTKSL